MSEGDWIHNRFFPQSKTKADPLLCHCGKVALYRVKDKGFCRTHRADSGPILAKRNAQQDAAGIAKHEVLHFWYDRAAAKNTLDANKREREKARRS